MSTELIQDATRFIENWVPRKVYHIEARYLDDLKMQMRAAGVAGISLFQDSKFQL
jgi:uncharacterized BrkB/YihY/UPF0761 family membrane protein